MSKQDGRLTGLFGAPVSDRENSMTAGPRGPLLMQDVYYLEQMSHFDREVIPERRMHAKVLAHLVLLLSQMTLLNTQMLKFSLKLVNKQKCLHVSQQFQVNVVY